MCRAKNLIVQVSAKVRSRKRKTFLRTTCNENIVKNLYQMKGIKKILIQDHLQREDVILKQHCRTKLKSIMTWYLFEFQLGMVTLDRLCRLVHFQTLVFGWVPTIPTVFGLTWHWRFHIKFWSDILVILNLKGFQWCRRRQTVVRINGVALLEIKDPNLGLTGVKNDQMSHYFRNLPVNGHDLYDTENYQLKLSIKWKQS